uniref:S-locus glycoprotein domain-containing protein n=1 Tax=Oryza barthii TaxID=65489 RepID=A0A0D3FQK7_9ORYZ
MRLGRNPRTGTEWSLTLWRAPDDPMMGDCRHVIDTRRLLDNISWCSADKKYRTGQWNGMWFSGVPEMASYSSMWWSSLTEIAYIFTAAAPFSRLVLTEAGVIYSKVWNATALPLLATATRRNACGDARRVARAEAAARRNACGDAAATPEPYATASTRLAGLGISKSNLDGRVRGSQAVMLKSNHPAR